MVDVSRLAEVGYQAVWGAAQKGKKLQLDTALKVAEATNWEVALASLTNETEAEVLERYVVFRLSEQAKRLQARANRAAAKAKRKAA